MVDKKIQTILWEVGQAFNSNRPTVILLSADSLVEHQRVQKDLIDFSHQKHFNFHDIYIDQHAPNIASVVQQIGNFKNTLFFVANLGRGAGRNNDVYRSLNFMREYFIENCVKIVICLTTQEEIALSKWAPDFWSFRHLAVRLTKSRKPRLPDLPSGVMIWHKTSFWFSTETEKDIGFASDLLSNLPDTFEASASRLDLLYVLGHLFWSIGQLKKAEESIRTGISLSQGYEFYDYLIRFINANNIILYEQGCYAEILDSLEPNVIKEYKDEVIDCNVNLSYYALGKRQIALKSMDRCVRINPENPSIMRANGYLQLNSRKYDEARQKFQTMVEKFPGDPSGQIGLAVCDYLSGVHENSRENIIKASKHILNPDIVFDICYNYILGQKDKSLKDYFNALDEGGRKKWQLLRDPNIFFLLEEARL